MISRVTSSQTLPTVRPGGSAPAAKSESPKEPRDTVRVRGPVVRTAVKSLLGSGLGAAAAALPCLLGPIGFLAGVAIGVGGALATDLDVPSQTSHKVMAGAFFGATSALMGLALGPAGVAAGAAITGFRWLLSS